MTPLFSYELAIVSTTNFLLTIAFSYVAGALFSKATRFSAAWWWAFTSLALSISSYIAGINHGFFEGRAASIADVLFRVVNISIGITTCGIYICSFLQFLKPSKLRTVAFYCVAIDFIIYFVYFYTTLNVSYLPVILNYGIAFLALFIFNISFWKTKGSLALLIFIAITVLESILQQQSRLIFFNGLLDYNSIYHLMGAFSALFFYYAGLRLDGIKH